jgi:hypothetical protein
MVGPSYRTCRTLTTLVILLFAGVLASSQTQDTTEKPVQRPILVNLSPPGYPPLALAARVDGDVDLVLGIRKDGTLESATVAKGPQLLRQAALDSAQKSHFECQGCGDAVTIYRFTYTFQLGPTRYCTTTNLSPQQTEPEQPRPQVSHSNNHVTVMDSPVGTCDLPAEVKGKVRSAKCLYLWRCGLH